MKVLSYFEFADGSRLFVFNKILSLNELMEFENDHGKLIYQSNDYDKNIITLMEDEEDGI